MEAVGSKEIPEFFLPLNAVFYPRRLYSSKNCYLSVHIAKAI
jgi:hypothetical protein